MQKNILQEIELKEITLNDCLLINGGGPTDTPSPADLLAQILAQTNPGQIKTGPLL